MRAASVAYKNTQAEKIIRRCSKKRFDHARFAGLAVWFLALPLGLGPIKAMKR